MSYVQGFYNEAVEFFRTFYGMTFKDNPNVEKVVITELSTGENEESYKADPYGVLDISVRMNWK